MQKFLETNICKAHYSESLQKLAYAMVSLLNQKVVEYSTLFSVSNHEN